MLDNCENNSSHNNYFLYNIIYYIIFQAEVLERERLRIKSGKDLQEAKLRLQEQEMQKVMEQRRREKIEDQKARERVRAQIEADKQARK